MADGTFAVLMVILGLADMGQHHCGTEAGCLGRVEATPRVAISTGRVLERRAKPADETYIRYDIGHENGPFGNAVGISVGEHGETWVGYGQTWTSTFGPLYMELHLMPGLYLPNGGFDLGGPVVFRSGIEIGFSAWSYRFGIAYDHRSHAGIFGRNPGIETVQYKISRAAE